MDRSLFYGCLVRFDRDYSQHEQSRYPTTQLVNWRSSSISEKLTPRLNLDRDLPV
ncbi:MAG: hypothetical protein HC778_06475 [Chamaesiphon sp. CSU_1_12]|nr:hypothetical protein [Chamaesiphon sp. CSU_1_12]